MSSTSYSIPRFVRTAPWALSRGAAQVMFQDNPWTGLLFIIGIFAGSYIEGMPVVAWGALAGLVTSTLAGMFFRFPTADGRDGLWGFNGILVGCALPTFLANTWQMWLLLIFGAAISTWGRSGLNKLLASINLNSLTFPFVATTWILLLASSILGLEAPITAPEPTVSDTSIISLTTYWLKGISQVFLINSWVTGLLFLIGLAIARPWAAVWAAIASAISLIMAYTFNTDPSFIANGLFGFNPVLTAIAIGCTFYKPSLKTTILTLLAIIATYFIHIAIQSLLTPCSLPTLTAPFCLTTWLTLLIPHKN